jgi:hypothetical protein
MHDIDPAARGCHSLSIANVGDDLLDVRSVERRIRPPAHRANLISPREELLYEILPKKPTGASH